jgi:glycosyltransferase involved in cell wall biosynthesis
MQEHNMETKPLVSIVIACYNDAQYIEQAVQSALSQTYSNIEIIVVDDGSNAETKAVLKKTELKITKLITQENQGQSTARNIGIYQAKGDYIVVLDSDDFFEPPFCEKAIEIILKNNNIKLVTCHANRILNNKILDIYKPRGGVIKDFLFVNCAMGSVMFKKSDWKKINGYDQEMTKGFEDWEFYIRLLNRQGSAYVINESLFNYRLRNDSTTSKANKIKYELLSYIYFKHRELYIGHFDELLIHLLYKIETEEIQKIKNTQRLEFKIGKFILLPLRWVKTLFR